jgi:peptidoglycan/LPS O-acetylase OafA/YrhL
MPSNFAPALHAGKVLHLESLRGLAALTVVVHHYNVGTVLSDTNFFGNGWLMVDFFFVLSGFVIALNYQDRLDSAASLVVFQARRFLRLYPLHLLMLLVMLGVEILKHVAQSRYGVLAQNPPFSTNDGVSFLQHLTLTQSLVNDGGTWNGPSWSISAEFFTYLIFALMVLWLPRRRTWIIAGAGVLSAAGLVYVVQQGFDFHLMRCVMSFFIGVIAWNASKLTSAVVRGWFVHLLAVIVLAGLCLVSWPAWRAVSAVAPFAFGLLLLALALSPPEIAIKRLLGLRPLVHLGTVSYGIYMIHWAVWWVVHQAVRMVGGGTAGLTAEGREVIVASPGIAWAGLLGGLVAVVWLADWSYRRVEMPFNAMRHSLRPGLRTAA